MIASVLCEEDKCNILTKGWMMMYISFYYTWLYFASLVFIGWLVNNHECMDTPHTPNLLTITLYNALYTVL